MRLRFGRVGLASLLLALVTAAGSALAADPWIVFQGKDGPGKGKKVVLVSGDEEYRSEEGLPQLAKILSERHGFTCTVLFSINPKDGTIDPNFTGNIPGLEALKDADLMIIQTRFRDLPDEQMKHVADFVEAGKPIIGLRTATHAFSIPDGKTYSRFSWNGNVEGWKGGFGRQILGETWVKHWGQHGAQSTRGIIAPGQENNPIVRGCQDIWGPTDVYEAHLGPESTPLILGQVLEGMKPTDKPLTNEKNNPLMPVAWTKMYKAGGDQTGKAFATTMGAATDLQSEGLRRLIVNASYWGVGLEVPEKANVDLVGEYHPTPFGFNGFQKGKKPEDYAKE